MTTTPDTVAGSRARREESGFLPIADYAMLSDSSSAALVARDGSIDWLCLPRFDSPSLFGRILDPDAGHWQIVPAGEYEAERRYLPGTLVLETTFTTPSGTARLIDALVFEEGQRAHELGMNPPHELLRSVEGVEGSVEFVMELAPRPEYGLVHPLIRLQEGGVRTFGGPNPIAIRTPVPLDVENATISSTIEGRRTAGKKPSASGAPKPTATTMSRFVKARSMVRRSPRRRSRRYA